MVGPLTTWPECWHRALPLHSQPLLYLMESRKREGRSTKRPPFWAQAQKLDAVNPEVRRAALRPVGRPDGRHLGSRSRHLAEQDVAALEALPQAQVADRPAFLVAMRWASAVNRRRCRTGFQLFRPDRPPAGEFRGGDSSVRKCRRLRRIGEADFDRHVPQVIPRSSGVAGLRRQRVSVFSVMTWGVPFTIPTAWHARLWQELTNARGKLEGRQLEVLGKAALHTTKRNWPTQLLPRPRTGRRPRSHGFCCWRPSPAGMGVRAAAKDCIAADCRARAAPARYVIINEAMELRRGRRNAMSRFFDWFDSENWHDFSMTTEQIHAGAPTREARACISEDRHARFHVPFREAVFLDDQELENDDEPIRPRHTNQLGTTEWAAQRENDRSGSTAICRGRETCFEKPTARLTSNCTRSERDSRVPPGGLFSNKSPCPAIAVDPLGRFPLGWPHFRYQLVSVV